MKKELKVSWLLCFGILLFSLPQFLLAGEISAHAASNITGAGKSEFFSSAEIKEIQDFQTKFWNIRNNDVVENKFDVEPVVGPSQYALGKLKKNTLDNATDYLSLIREKAGLLSVTSTEERNTLTQCGTVGMAAVRKWSHELDLVASKPVSMTSDFWMQANYATRNSNIGNANMQGGSYKNYATTFNEITDAFLDDGGQSYVAHRVSLLNPETRTVGLGYAYRLIPEETRKEIYTALYIPGDGSGLQVPEDTVVSWPTTGTFPTYYLNSNNTIRWSASFVSQGYSLDKSQIKVTLTNDKTKQQWTFSEAKSDGFFNVQSYWGYENVIFDPDSIKCEEGDSFTVKIEGLTGAKTSHQYTTKFYDLSKEYKAGISVSSVEISPKSQTLEAGKILQMASAISPSDAVNKNVTWSSSNESVASVDGNGKVTAVKAGTAAITVRTADGGKTATSMIAVTAPTVESAPEITPVTGVSVNAASTTLAEGAVRQMVAIVSPGDATDKSVTWSSSNTSVATVSASGVVTANAAGASVIIARTNDGNKTASKLITVTASETVTETISVTGVSVSSERQEMNTGETQQMTAAVLPGNATNQNVTWSSSNESIATVDANGKVTTIAPGLTIIRVRTADGSKVASRLITVAQFVPVTGIEITEKRKVMNVGEATQLSAAVTPADAGNRSISWRSGNSDIVTVDANGTITAVSPGMTVVFAESADGKVKGKCSVYVNSLAKLGSSKATAVEVSLPFDSSSYSSYFITNQSGWIKFRAPKTAMYGVGNTSAFNGSSLDVRFYSGSKSSELGYYTRRYYASYSSITRSSSVYYEQGEYVYLNVASGAGSDAVYYFRLKMDEFNLMRRFG